MLSFCSPFLKVNEYVSLSRVQQVRAEIEPVVKDYYKQFQQKTYCGRVKGFAVYLYVSV